MSSMRSTVIYAVEKSPKDGPFIEPLLPDEHNLSRQSTDLESLHLAAGAPAATRWRVLLRQSSPYILAALLLSGLVYLITPKPQPAPPLQRTLRFAQNPIFNPLSVSPRTLPVTAGVVPQSLHRHNDYAKPNPLFSALAWGYSSVEADVWLNGSQVLLGHHFYQLNTLFTLRSVYIDPLVRLLEEANKNSSSNRGVFDMDPSLPLQLLLDFKMGDVQLYRAVLGELEPLRRRGWLTTYTPEHGLIPGPITAIASGSVDPALIVDATRRDLFLDAPLATLADTSYDANVAPMASTSYSAISWTRVFPWKRKKHICELVDTAHQRGITTRFWGMPRRVSAWREVLDCGTDWLNVDILSEAVDW